MELEGSLSLVGMKLVLLIVKVKHRTMTSYIQYKVQYKYNIQYIFRPNHPDPAAPVQRFGIFQK